jgi:hypothetical protein
MIMNKFKILESYKNQTPTKSSQVNFLDGVTREFKSFIIESVKSNFLKKYLKDEKTIKKFCENLDKQIRLDCNSMNIPYFHILENLNLCVEVEMSQDQILFEDSQVFGKKKFSDILESGIQTSIPINRFAISESKFKGFLVDLVKSYTKDFELTEDSLKIEFN